MVRLQLLNLQPPSSRGVEADAFILAGDRVLSLPGERLVATHVRNQWQIGNDHYLRLEIVQPVTCDFQAAEDVHEKRGPFSRVVAVDGVLMADDQGLAIIKGAVWKSLLNELEWTRITVKPTD